MAHKPLIGGTAYEIKGGKTLIDGTAYSIKSGKTLVGGTAYEVGFGADTAIVRLMSDTFEDGNYASAYINYITPDGDTGSLSTAGTYELPIGTSITCSLKFRGKDRASLSIYFNGDNVESSQTDASYSFTLTQNIAIRPYNLYYNGGTMHVAEVPENAVVFMLSYYEIYGAENGMTWAEWCNSDYYNANSGVTISGNSVICWGHELQYNGNAVKPTDAILDGVEYY